MAPLFADDRTVLHPNQDMKLPECKHRPRTLQIPTVVNHLIFFDFKDYCLLYNHCMSLHRSLAKLRPKNYLSGYVFCDSNSYLSKCMPPLLRSRLEISRHNPDT